MKSRKGSRAAQSRSASRIRIDGSTSRRRQSAWSSSDVHSIEFIRLSSPSWAATPVPPLERSLYGTPLAPKAVMGTFLLGFYGFGALATGLSLLRPQEFKHDKLMNVGVIV